MKEKTLLCRRCVHKMPPCPQCAVNSKNNHRLSPVVSESCFMGEVNKKEAIKDLKIYEQLDENEK